MATLAGRSAPALADTPLGQTIATTATDIWNDSCAVAELEYAISFGAVGATANPTIVADVWKGDPDRWRGRVQALATQRPDVTEVDLAWAVVEEMSLLAAPLLLPAFEASGGRQGRLSMQTDPTLFRSFDRMLAQGEGFARLAPNIIVKFPATKVGVRVMEEATYRGVNVNATVSFSVAQALAAGEAVERGLRRREAEDLPIDDMGPVITLMMGRLEDWLRVQTERDGIVADPAVLPWSGVAVFKRAYAEFQGRGLRARLLGAAIRHHLHWSELDRGRRGRHPARGLAAAVQRVVDRGPSTDGRPGRTGRRRRTPDSVPGLRPGVRARRADPRRVRCLRAECPDASGVRRLVPRAAASGRRCPCPEP